MEREPSNDTGLNMGKDADKSKQNKDSQNAEEAKEDKLEKLKYEVAQEMGLETKDSLDTPEEEE